MARFIFQLEPVLLQREAREEAAEQALALAHNEYNNRCAVLRNTRQNLEQALTRDEEKIDVFENMHLNFYRESLSEKITAQEEDVYYAANAVEHSRQEAVQARQERQAIEKLKEKHLQKHKLEEEAREQKIVDEMALYAHFRSTE
jgi:flagellar FliJ protein